MAYQYRGKILKEGRSWTNADGVQITPNWMIWSEEEKLANGLELVPEPEYVDERFYWAAGIPRALEDSEETGTGLKTRAIEVARQTAGSLLAPTDWMVVRSVELDEAIPSEVAEYRASVRAAYATIKAAILGCQTLEEFIELYSGVDGSVAAINNWPMINNR